MPEFSEFPIAFWLAVLALAGGGVWAWQERRQGWGLPALMVIGTVAVWYVGDVLYNDYARYRMEIGDESLVSAWWQYLLFVLAFLAMAKPLHGFFNHKLAGRSSYAIRYLETRHLERPDVQRRITLAADGLFVAWGLLMAVALLRVKGDALGLFAPYLSPKADPWGRGQIGGGFSALISLASYLQIFLVAGAGVVVAVARDPKTRAIAGLICFLTLPYYVFDRTRNTMLATILPGLLAWVFLRLKGGLPFKFGALGVCFLLVNFWFTTVMANRSGMSFDVEAALSGKKNTEETRHEGLNMFEELAWIDHFIEAGTYLPNGGERYFAEAVNPIPRVLWKNKPTIGLDYALARGQAAVGPNGETTATISTGMIGQGVVNFGRIFGPVAAAFLMSLWVATLARMDLLGADPSRLLLYASGMILTFNMGRDITLLVIYPFLFGMVLIKGWQFLRPADAASGKARKKSSNRRRRRPAGRVSLFDRLDPMDSNNDPAPRLPHGKL